MKHWLKNLRSRNDRFTAGYISKAIHILFLIALSLPVSAQLSREGIPPSTRFGMESLSGSPILVDSPDLERIHAEDMADPIPYRFAVNLPVNAGLEKGTWTILPDGGKMWHLSVKTPGAKAVTVYFDRFNLPDAGELFLYNQDKTQILGAYTHENSMPGGFFATELISGDQVTLEYYQPEHVMELPGIRISEIAYAYRGVTDPLSETGFGASGPCEVNANCQEGEGWDRQKKGVTRIEVKKLGGTYWCTGSVVNNTRLDFMPYVLTADHCGNRATDDDLQQWVFYFGYQSTGCPDPQTEPGSNTMTGAMLKARSGDVTTVGGSDFYLILLNTDIPGTFDVIYNGWTWTNQASPDGVTIHHPMGDIKKISTYTTPLVSSNWSGNPGLTHWRVYWSATPNGHGVTEGGSSGAPIFDDNGYIVGTLTGGETDCDSANLNKPDYYGKFSYHWNSNGTDSSERLDYWLDPINSGVETLNGSGLGIDFHTGYTGLTIFPNPVMETGSSEAEVIHIHSQLFVANTSLSISVLDACGRIVFKSRTIVTDLNKITLDVSGIPEGFYIVKINSGSEQFTGKFLRL